MSEHLGDAPGPGLVYEWVDELDPLAAQFEMTPDVMPWARDIEVTDPDGNRIRLAERGMEPHDGVVQSCSLRESRTSTVARQSRLRTGP